MTDLLMNQMARTRNGAPTRQLLIAASTESSCEISGKI